MAKKKSKMTRSSVIERILSRQDQGKELTYSAIRKEDSTLESETYRLFGGWYPALDAAGIDSSIYRKQKPFGYWTKDRVISEIRRLEASGASLSFSDVRREYPALIQYALEFFGKWYPLLDSLGIDSRKYRKQVSPNYWTQVRILDTIKELKAAGNDIRPIALIKTHPGLMGSARRKFKNIELMYFQAGIDPSEIGMLRKWTKEKITSSLIELQRDGIDIKPSNLIENGYDGLIQAGRRLFGNLNAAYEAAGLNLASTGHKKKRCYRYTKDNAIQYLLELKGKGDDISPSSLEHHHFGLYSAGIGLFGSTWNFYEAAGLPPLEYVTLRKRGYWTKARVVEEIIRLDEIGEDLHIKVIEKNYLPLTRAAYKLFGSWHSACDAAKIPAEKYRINFPKGYYTPERVIQQILQLKQNEINLSSSAIARENPSLFAAGLGRFGTWYKALDAAGINSNEYRKGVFREGGAYREYWKKEKIINEIQTLGSRGADLSYTHMQKEHPPLVHAAENKFGSWAEAVLKAGLDYNLYRRQLPTHYWTKDKMIDKIKELNSKEENIRPNVLRKSYPGIYIWGRKIFGNIEELYREAGIDPDRIGLPKKWTRERIIEEIQKRAKEGRSLEFNSIRTEDSRLLSGAIRIFKSWFTAIDAAGIDSTKIRKKAMNGYWTETLIIDEIKKMVARGEQLSSSYAQKMHSDIYGGASKVFDSWGAAVEKSGFNYESIRMKHKDYSKEELQDFLKRLRKDDISIAFTTVRKINPSIVNSIIHRFGSYKKGIESIGLNYEDIRKDGLRECFKGVVFERYAKEVFELIGWRLKYNKLHKFKEGDCKPDFVDSSDGTWIDAKLDSNCWGVEETIEKYLDHCDRILIVFLKGKKRLWSDDRVDFIPISDFYEELREKETGEDLITDLEKLKKGVLKPELQAQLDKYQRKEFRKGIEIPSEQDLERAIPL